MPFSHATVTQHCGSTAPRSVCVQWFPKSSRSAESACPTNRAPWPVQPNVPTGVSLIVRTARHLRPLWLDVALTAAESLPKQVFAGPTVEISGSRTLVVVSFVPLGDTKLVSVSRRPGRCRNAKLRCRLNHCCSISKKARVLSAVEPNNDATAGEG